MKYILPGIVFSFILCACGEDGSQCALPMTACEIDESKICVFGQESILLILAEPRAVTPSADLEIRDVFIHQFFGKAKEDGSFAFVLEGMDPKKTYLVFLLVSGSCCELREKRLPIFKNQEECKKFYPP